MNNIIEVNKLVKRFGDRAVLDGLSLKVPEGKITVIMGGSGCGKSTLLKNLIGLQRPEEGEIWIEGKNVAKAFEDGRIAEICKYCEADVELTRKIYYRMIFEKK